MKLSHFLGDNGVCHLRLSLVPSARADSLFSKELYNHMVGGRFYPEVVNGRPLNNGTVG